MGGLLRHKRIFAGCQEGSGARRLYFGSMLKLIRRACCTILVLTSGSVSCDNSLPPSAKGPQPVTWTAEVADQTPAADGSVLVNVRVKASIENGWHVYAPSQTGEGPTPLTVKVDSSSSIAMSTGIGAPVPDKSLDPNFGIETATYSGQPVITVPIRISAAALKSRKPIDVKVRSQACSDKFCLPAKTTTLSVTLPPLKT